MPIAVDFGEMPIEETVAPEFGNPDVLLELPPFDPHAAKTASTSNRAVQRSVLI
jgi:hypothetical protein